MDVFEAVDQRVTARELGEPGPSPNEVDRILAAGVRAPDHGRIAPWRFVVLRGDGRAVLGDAMAEMRRQTDPESSRESLQSERAKAFRAPVVVVVSAHLSQGHRIPEVEQIAAVAACTQNMITAAGALGFTANWKTGAAAYHPGVKAALGIDEADQIIAILQIGTLLSDTMPRPPMLDGLVRYF
jgi:nitroreductase